jgi:hypothetical protein
MSDATKKNRTEEKRRGIPRRMWDVLCMVYYRYSVEIGICVLERWEAALVNIYFLLLFCSLLSQFIKTASCLCRVLYSALMAASQYFFPSGPRLPSLT